MFHLPESRWAAFGGHLVLSILIFGSVALFTYFILLPGFLFYSENGSTILTLIGGVDVVLGPLITLIIYKKAKPEIKMDLSIIAAVQIAALIYGVYSLWSVRPLAVFYGAGEYHVVYHSTFEEPTPSDISNIRELQQLKTPTYGVLMPEGVASLTELSFKHVISTGKSYFSQPELYYDYQEAIPHLSKSLMPIPRAVERQIIKDPELKKLDPSKYGVASYVSNVGPGYMLINTETGDFVRIL